MATAVMSEGTPERGSPAASCIQLGFRLDQSMLALDVADDASLSLIRHGYAKLMCEPPPSRPQASVRRLSDGRLHVRYGRHALRVANAADAVPMRAAYHAAREIFARFACEPPQTIALYGALCAVGDAGVLLLGPTTIGKTVLALHMAHHGARFLGDDTAILALSSGEAYAMPRRPSLRESALALLPDPRMAESVAASQRCFSTERGRFWYSLDTAALYGIEPSDRRYDLRAVCIVRERAEEPAIREIDAAQGVKHLAQRAYVRPTSLAQLAALRRATRRASFFEVVLGAPEVSSEMLLQAVRACG